MKPKLIKTHLIRIGNSKGVRLPKVLLELSGIQDQVEIVAKDGEIVIRPSRESRTGWAASFQEMAAYGDDAMLNQECVTEWDAAEWEWK